VTFNDKWRVFFSANRRSTRVLRIDFIASEIGVQVATEQKTYTRSPSGRADAPTSPRKQQRGFAEGQLAKSGDLRCFLETPGTPGFAGRRYLNGLLKKDRTQRRPFAHHSCFPTNQGLLESLNRHAYVGFLFRCYSDLNYAKAVLLLSYRVGSNKGIAAAFGHFRSSASTATPTAPL
jgi:hypothetical protein